MNRHVTILTLCCLFLLADALCIKQTVDFRGFLSNSMVVMLIAVESIIAAASVALGYTMFRKTYARQKKPATRRTVPVLFEPLRRLFVSVWS
jgi:flagellar basal body-associated protein FliL